MEKTLLSKLITFTDGGVIVRIASKTGFQLATVGDGVNVGAINSTTRRGRVQKQISGTLTTMDDMAVIINVPNN